MSCFSRLLLGALLLLLGRGITAFWLISMMTSSSSSLNTSGGTHRVQRAATEVVRLRKAAGGKCFDTFLATLIEGQWNSSTEMDAIPDKNAAHMAAWKGCLQNLKYLVEEMGCDIDTISTGQFSYGKTPIFFALTQSRPDVVEYLLEQGACVKIVNNKGQSPLSIASSHLSESLILRIEQEERAQHAVEWRNYRVTHSDGLTYGDLDPRFLFERSVTEADVVTAYAINPTTKSIRRGIFQRNNPKVVGLETEKNRHQSKQQRRQKDRTSPPPLLLPISDDEQRELDDAWERLEKRLSISLVQGGDPIVGEATPDDHHLLTVIVRLNANLKRAWIPDAALRLMRAVDGDCVRVVQFILASTASATDTTTTTTCADTATPDELLLLQRLAKHLTDPSNYRQQSDQCTSAAQHTTLARASIADERWSAACEHVKDLCIASLENGATQTYLSLPTTPVWVDSLEQLAAVQQSIQSVPLVAIDAEWHDSNGEDALLSLSTLQVAVVVEGDTTSASAWVLDLLSPDTIFLDQCRTFIVSIFRDNKTVLGFAVGHDVPRLEAFCKEPLSNKNVLDVQQLLWSPTAAKKNQMPGLAACVREFAVLPLSKAQQCSDWSRRPLSNAQLEYAGLDAAVLPFLLAEKKRADDCHENNNGTK